MPPLLEATINALAPAGDGGCWKATLTPSLDAERLRAVGCCRCADHPVAPDHLDCGDGERRSAPAPARLSPADLFDLALEWENVGNLVFRPNLRWASTSRWRCSVSRSDDNRSVPVNVARPIALLITKVDLLPLSASVEGERSKSTSHRSNACARCSSSQPASGVGLPGLGTSGCSTQREQTRR